MTSVKNTSNPQIIAFKTQKSFENWLSKNYSMQEGIFMQIYKKDSGIKTITYAQALDVALCYGWIDGVKKSYNEVSWLQKFTPRRAKSIWSKINVAHVTRLMAENRIQPPGIQEVEKAKADGRWEKAYEAQRDMEVPEDFLKAVSKNKEALAFFESLNKTNKYAIAFRLHNAKKPETREKRLKEFVQMMKDRKKFY